MVVFSFPAFFHVLLIGLWIKMLLLLLLSLLSWGCCRDWLLGCCFVAIMVVDVVAEAGIWAVVVVVAAVVVEDSMEAWDWD